MNMKNELYPAVNVHHFEVDGRWFLLDGDTGYFCEETKLTKKIIEMLPCTLEDMREKLSHDYTVEEIEQEYQDIKKAYEDKVIGYKNPSLYQGVDIKEEDWLNSKVLLNLWLNVSNDCNMRCIYCFEHGGDYGKTKKIMSIDKIKDCIDYWYKYLNKDAKDIYVIFFGGEPLLNKKGIKYAVEYVRELLKKHNIRSRFSITSNATLLDEDFAEFLVENKIPITISIDGGRDIQNKNRPLASGANSFGIVNKNVQQLMKIRKNLTARVTLVHEDVGHLVDIVKDLWEMGFGQVQYDLVSTEDPQLKITEEDLVTIEEQVKIIADMMYENVIHDQWKVLRNLTKIVDCVNFPVWDLTGCSYYAPYTIMVDPTGEIYKCQRLMDEEYCTGDIYNGIKWNKFYLKKPINEECETCWVKSICGAGCPQVRLMNTGDINKNSKLWCDHVKIITNEALKFYAKLYMYNPEIFEELRQVNE